MVSFINYALTSVYNYQMSRLTVIYISEDGDEIEMIKS